MLPGFKGCVFNNKKELRLNVRKDKAYKPSYSKLIRNGNVLKYTGLQFKQSTTAQKI